MGGALCITSIAAFSTFFTNIQTGHEVAKYLFALVFIWFTVAAAIVSFKEGKWIPTIGAWARVFILGFGTVALTGAGQALGSVAAIAFILALLTSGTTWIMGVDRTLAVTAFDGGGPRILGRFSRRFGTPIYVNVMSGLSIPIWKPIPFPPLWERCRNW